MQRLGRGIPYVSYAENMARSNIGFNRVIWANYPNPKVSEIFTEGAFSDLWLYDIIHGISSYENIIPYPVMTIKAKSGDNLSKIAETYTGRKTNWKAIWALNMGKISNPNEIKKGEGIIIPAKIKNWKKINLSDYSSFKQIALIEYRDINFTKLARYLIQKQLRDEPFEKQYQICFIPIFPDTFEHKNVLMVPILPENK